jgi:diketogulonate reductase-like aldo/keto reductase
LCHAEERHVPRRVRRQPARQVVDLAADLARRTKLRREAFRPAGRSVGVIGQGTYELERADRAAAVAALRRGLDAGMELVDTAEIYGGGRVEELVGEALAGRRDEAFLVGKVDPARASRRGTVAACEESLRRLRTDRLDLVLLHWIGPHPLEETVAAFEELVAAGKALAWGLSNVDAGWLDRASEAAEATAGPAADQVLYHLEERAIEHALLPACAERGIAVIAHSPFGAGRFPRRGSRGRRALDAVAAARRAAGRPTTPRQVALAFLVRHPGVFAIPRTADPAHAADNAAAGDLTLTAEEIAHLAAAYPLGPPRPGVPLS